ncbi:MAG TPA: FeoB-associated Cys-rich membrane protein [Anaerovoracaceae bacterium]|nr:FeoB-associated Cys-rich membrane protein [Anaerovoracaceae bacterium]
MLWINENIGSIIVGAVLVAVVAAIIASQIKAHRAGKSSCGCGCANCPMSGSCHQK